MMEMLWIHYIEKGWGMEKMGGLKLSKFLQKYMNKYKSIYSTLYGVTMQPSYAIDNFPFIYVDAACMIASHWYSCDL